MKTIVSLLWGSSGPVFIELARRGWNSFAWLAPPGEAVLEQLNALGASGRTLTIDPARHDAYPVEADERVARLGPIVDQAIAPLGASRGREAGVAAAARATYRASIEKSMQVIDALDEAHRSGGIAAIVLNETETRFGRVPARWARSRGVPVFMVTHGANLNRYYTCTAGVEADRTFVYGERGMDALLDQGIAREKLAVTGNPGWDGYAERRALKAAVREQLVAAANFRPELPIVLFVTTWAAKLSAFGDPTLQERLVRAVFTACARLETAGTRLNLLVKARPLDRMGQAELAAVAASAGLGGFGFTNGDMATPLSGADLVVGYDTGAFVEAMLLDVPCINLWDESSWIFGPPFAVTDAVPLVPMDDPERLAGAMHEVLFNPATRERLSANAALRVNALSLPGQGAAARVADQIAQALAS
ncbi:MAG: hypothetical protein ABSH03_23680 [Candidatus Lustribacter sp.]|jgi:hypothetical protein